MLSERLCKKLQKEWVVQEQEQEHLAEEFEAKGGIPDRSCPRATLGLHQNRVRKKTRQSAGETGDSFSLSGASGAQLLMIMRIAQR